jgi:FkbM family methyltransferase
MLPFGRRPVFLDAGANIGGASALFALTAGFGGAVVAVEANPKTHALLERNVAQFRCDASAALLRLRGGSAAAGACCRSSSTAGHTAYLAEVSHAPRRNVSMLPSVHTMHADLCVLPCSGSVTTVNRALTSDALAASGHSFRKIVLCRSGLITSVAPQAHSPTGRFDFIKLDVEGEEKQVLSDPASRAVLCEARCLFMEARPAPGACKC